MTQCHIPEDVSPQQYHNANLNSCEVHRFPYSLFLLVPLPYSLSLRRSAGILNIGAQEYLELCVKSFW
jgi:hypothetical protein